MVSNLHNLAYSSTHIKLLHRRRRWWDWNACSRTLNRAPHVGKAFLQSLPLLQAHQRRRYSVESKSRLRFIATQPPQLDSRDFRNGRATPRLVEEDALLAKSFLSRVCSGLAALRYRDRMHCEDAAVGRVRGADEARDAAHGEQERRLLCLRWRKDSLLTADGRSATQQPAGIRLCIPG